MRLRAGNMPSPVAHVVAPLDDIFTIMLRTKEELRAGNYASILNRMTIGNSQISTRMLFM